jgi:hypothetical protein
MKSIPLPEREVQYFKNAGARVIYHLPSHKKSENMKKQLRPNRGKIYEYNPRTAFRLSLHLSEYFDLYINEITVTYPAEFPTNGEIVRRHRHLVISWLKYHGVKEYTTVLEFQERGAPHIHILVDAWIGKEKLTAAWSKIVGQSSMTYVAKIQDPTKTKTYMASYARKKDQKKVPDGYENVGKWWTSNRSVKPQEIEKIEYNTEKELMRENRNIARWRKSVKRKVKKVMWIYNGKTYKQWKIKTGRGFFAWGNKDHIKTTITRLKHQEGIK